jgi:general secretion pathway protein C
VYARLGLANGDIVDALNGRPLHSLEEALDAYTALRATDRLALSVVRRGAPLTLTVTITP